MPAFKLALTLIARKRTFVLLYLVGLTALGLLIINSVSGTSFDTFDEEKPPVAIIDRDGSEISEGLTAYLAARTTRVSVADTREALQDATARNIAPYILIIPEGFGADFARALRADAAPPRLDTVVNYQFFTGYFLDATVDGYLAALRITALGYPDLSLAEQLAKADAAAGESIQVEVYQTGDAAAATSMTMYYLQWISYPLTAGLLVLVAVVFSTATHGEVRRRNLASPVSPAKLTTQVAAGCVALVLIAWALAMAASLLPFVGGLDLLRADPGAFGMLAAGALVYGAVCAALGFLVSQFGLRQAAENGIANIVSLTFGFVSGVFMGGTNLLGEGVVAAAHFTPTYWYSEAVLAVQHGEPSTVFWTYTGISALFGVAFYAIALLVGRLKAS